MSNSNTLTPRDVISPDDPSTWDKAWKAGITPWDKREIQPPLREAIENDSFNWPTTGRALVPGCGGGYDAVYIASALGLDTLGIDIAETAMVRAHEYLASQPTPKGKVTFALQDFFTLPTANDNDRFDVVYDYTFFVAIPPKLRNDWGRKMSELVKPGGLLITLMFPIDPLVELGPPYFLRPEHYDEPLGGNFVKLLEKVPEESSESHKGRERLAVWRRI